MSGLMVLTVPVVLPMEETGKKKTGREREMMAAEAQLSSSPYQGHLLKGRRTVLGLSPEETREKGWASPRSFFHDIYYTKCEQ